eukprot:gb/GEZN01003900.1/.p1 GENE.gb/GEZN01003900.1/~~gb/GEZN01003900.1/.p1  ORF type:complete len:679 (-),score=111.04 gb/GEZN01003900.1/:33-1787(-)
MLSDDGSTNGTVLNGKRIPNRQKIQLYGGDLITLGAHEIHIHGGIPRPVTELLNFADPVAPSNNNGNNNGLDVGTDASSHATPPDHGGLKQQLIELRSTMESQRATILQMKREKKQTQQKTLKTISTYEDKIMDLTFQITYGERKYDERIIELKAEVERLQIQLGVARADAELLKQHTVESMYNNDTDINTPPRKRNDSNSGIDDNSASPPIVSLSLLQRKAALLDEARQNEARARAAETAQALLDLQSQFSQLQQESQDRLKEHEQERIRTEEAVQELRAQQERDKEASKVAERELAQTLEAMQELRTQQEQDREASKAAERERVRLVAALEEEKRIRTRLEEELAVKPKHIPVITPVTSPHNQQPHNQTNNTLCVMPPPMSPQRIGISPAISPRSMSPRVLSPKNVEIDTRARRSSWSGRRYSVGYTDDEDEDSSGVDDMEKNWIDRTPPLATDFATLETGPPAAAAAAALPEDPGGPRNVRLHLELHRLLRQRPKSLPNKRSADGQHLQQVPEARRMIGRSSSYPDQLLLEPQGTPPNTASTVKRSATAILARRHHRRTGSASYASSTSLDKMFSNERRTL